LPAKDDHDITLLTPTSDDAGYFAHPVVVLWVDKQNNAQVFVITSLGGKCLTSYRKRARYLAIHPAEHPDNNDALFLDDQLLLDKKSFVMTQSQRTLNCKMLKPYRDRQSGKQYKLKAESLTELLKHANISLLPIFQESSNLVTANPNPTLCPGPSRRPLAPLSNNSVRGYETDIERHAGLSVPSRTEAREFTTYAAVLSRSSTRPVWGQAAVAPADPFSRDARHVRQHLRAHSYIPHNTVHESSTLLGHTYHQAAPEQGDPEPPDSNSSWFTVPRCLLAIFAVAAYGVFAFLRR
jgi:hypothetical protein